MPEVDGFVLQPTYRIRDGAPVVHLFGRLFDGRTFLVRDNRLAPYFFVAAADGERARALGAAQLKPSRRRSMPGQALARIEVATPADAPPLRDRLHRNDVPTFEADVRFAMRYLIDRGVRGALSIRGTPSVGDGTDVVFDNPEITAPSASERRPELRVLSLDIETNPFADRLLSVALSGCGEDLVLLIHPEPPDEAHVQAFPGERALLEALVGHIRRLDPDIVTGWNVIGFDLAFLARRARRLGVPLEIGRGRGPLRLRRQRRDSTATDPDEASIPGRLVLDGLRLLRSSFVRMDSYSLESVSRKVLGTGKTITGGNRVQEILRLHRDAVGEFVDYNLLDAQLVLRILDELDLIRLTVERSLLTGMPMDRVSASVASFDFLYLSALGGRGYAAPSVGTVTGTPEGFGGTVLQPPPGLFENVMVFDFKSLYPSLMRTFEIDPLGYYRAPRTEDPIRAPNGAAFAREPSILGAILDELFAHRESAKAEGAAIRSQAIKILMNSFYGVLGTPACRFFTPKIAAAITSLGRHVLLWCRDTLRRDGWEVVYGDTDSLFVVAKDPLNAWSEGRDLAAELNRRVGAHVAERWQVESQLEIEFEQIYRKLFFPRLRHGSGGTAKRYVGLSLYDENAAPHLQFTGMEVVRRDGTKLGRQVQTGTYERFFAERPIESFLKRTVEHLRRGELDEELVYRKALRKRLDEYIATTPPHVAAARKMSRPPRRVIDYVMTVEGPQPAAERSADLDYEHYVDRQVRAVCEPVLEHLELDFAKVIGDDTQLGLFD